MILSTSKKRRSIRRYSKDEVSKEDLLYIVRTGSNYPSRANKQPLKYLVINDKELCNKVFSSILWGSKVSQYKVFSDIDYSPKAYILVMVDKTICSAGYEYELGASIGMMLLAATYKELGSLWVKSFDKNKLLNELNITDENIIIDSIVCLGKPSHKSTIIEYKDSTNVEVLSNYDMIVPKRQEKEVIYINEYNR